MSLEDNEVLYKLMQSLDNDDNANFVELTSQKIKQIKMTDCKSCNYQEKN